ncbi:ASCH domain-containing protein [Burkholderia arboris]|uniref:ASCH domain-containing protein n=1 Tax=Burkholderia TaxID=32008 RepID=UPI0030F0093E
MHSRSTYKEGVQAALSIRQPWAELILSGRKSIEIRSWSTEYRGAVWLHTGQKRAPELDRQFAIDTPFVGGFVGQVLITNVLRLDLDRWIRWRTRHLVEGPMPEEAYGWVLREPVRFVRPIPAPGELRLFYPSQGLEDILCKELSDSRHTS